MWLHPTTFLLSLSITDSILKIMKKRLRRKRLLGEFTVWYWTLIYEFSFEITRERMLEMRQGLFDLLNANNLSWSGGSNGLRGIFFVDTDKRYDSVTEAQRHLITAWLLEQPEVSRVVDRPLVKAPN